MSNQKKFLIKNAKVVNEGSITEGDILIEDGRIVNIGSHLTPKDHLVQVMDVQGSWVMPGVIDSQVHFREPGLTHKGNICIRIKGFHCWGCNLLCGATQHQASCGDH